MMTVIYYVKLGVILYLGVLAFLFFTQRQMIFFPDKNRPKLVEGAELVQVKTSDGVALESWYFPPKIPDGLTIIYFHGNAGNFSHRVPKIIPYLREGYGVLLAEYRGYGGNEGTPSEEGFYADGRAYFQWLKEKKSSKRIIVYGESIGSGTAMQMAVQFKVDGLVLETPFSSLVDVASSIYPFLPVRFLLRDRFENDKKIASIRAPVLILHGLRDETIAYGFARKLYDAAKEPKKFVDFPEGRHNNLYDFGAADHVLQFLSEIEKPKE